MIDVGILILLVLIIVAYIVAWIALEKVRTLEKSIELNMAVAPVVESIQKVKVEEGEMLFIQIHGDIPRNALQLFRQYLYKHLDTNITKNMVVVNGKVTLKVGVPHD